MRQWVLAFPPSLRFMLAYNHELCSLVIAIFVDEVMRWLRHSAKRELGLASVAQAHGATVTAIHRAGGSLNLQLHLHCAALDGVYLLPSAGRPKPEFRALPAPTRKDLEEIAARVYIRTRRKLRTRGMDWEDDTDSMDPAAGLGMNEQEPLLFDCAQASVRGVGLLGEQAGLPLFPRVSDREFGQH